MEKCIEKELKLLGIHKRYLGHSLIKRATLLVLENEERLRHVGREIYEPTAQIVGCSTKRVERNIRTMIFRAWDTNKKQLEKVAGVPLMMPPTVSEFIEYLADYVKENSVVSN